MREYTSCANADTITINKPSAVDNAAASPPAATSAAIACDKPAISGVASTTKSGSIFNSLNCKTPSPFSSVIVNNPVCAQFAVQLGSDAIGLPTTFCKISNAKMPHTRAR